MRAVVAFAKKTGDYAVLSQTDLSVVALTYQYEEEVNGETWIRTEPGQKLPPRLRKEETGSGGGDTHGAGAEAGIAVDEDEEDNDGGVEGANDGEPAHDVEEIRQTIEQVLLDSVSSTPASQGQQPPPPASNEPAVDFTGITPRQPRPTAAESPAPTEDPETDSDGGEWITPSNLPQHRSRDLGLVASGPKSAPQAHLAAACMTGDFAVQNVLLGMGLGLVGEGGKRIGNVKSWVLRCHGCFK
jgi:RNA-binding protein NOB1